MAATFEIGGKTPTLRELISLDASKGWEMAWLSGTTPWDVGCIQPPLEAVLRGGEIRFPRIGRALVPGCGKGYDAIFIGSYLGLQTTGIDISPTAVTLANEASRGLPSPPSNVSFEVCDFFDIKTSSQFDLVYDHKFFQALPPTLRGSWGAQMCNIVKPGGYLIVLAFPIDAPLATGPPYGIEESSHQSTLGDVWVKLLDRIPDNSSKAHVGRERLMVWRKK